MTRKLMHIVGARPNFMKVAPIIAAISRLPAKATISQVLVHTGQHYSPEMSDLFFRELGLPDPDINLEVGSGSHAHQTARIMETFEPVLTAQRPDAVLVVGDVNSTIACALVATKLGIRVIHVEAGLRSFDRSMPEEVNRVLTDQISDLLFTTEEGAAANLEREGIAGERVRFVGNVMIDTLLRHRERALARPTLSEVVAGRPLQSGKFGIVTLHRPSNVDDPHALASLLAVLAEVSTTMPLVFPVHPRTRGAIERQATNLGNIVLVPPQGYLDFLNLMANARAVFTDSGGVQEETTILGVPCLTLRENTERPVTISHGTNVLVGTQPQAIRTAAAAINRGQRGVQPPLWDGKAGERIAEVLADWL